MFRRDYTNGFDVPFDTNQSERDAMDRQERAIDATACRAGHYA